MDRSWINIKNRADPVYEKGAEDFVKWASDNRPHFSKILCPCRKCRNMIWVKKNLVVDHLVVNGFLNSYTSWIYHETNISSTSETNNEPVLDDGMADMIHDAFGVPPPDAVDGMDGTTTGGGGNQHNEGIDQETSKFFKLLNEAKNPLYPSCTKHSTLSFLVRLLHLKCLAGMPDKIFTNLLKLLKEAFPEGETLPKSFYEARKLIGNLGLEYKKVHACQNDCMLYWDETEKDRECKHCHAPRYKQFKDSPNEEELKERKIPAKVVRYFPLIPRLKRLYSSSKTASHMRWHAEGRPKDGLLRHPADSLAWRKFDELHPDFAEDIRNVRLVLSSDGFNPFRSMSISHSTWPVILMPLNLPPWLCMTQPYMILSLLIDGPSGPGNNIDIYLRLLVDELKELWAGVETYDVVSGQGFRLRASLLWTINDFPAYANLSGWSTKGKLGCPCCHAHTRSCYLSNGRKLCYMGHRRWLPQGHKFRKDKVSFDGTEENDLKPVRLSGREMYEQVKDIHNEFGKDKCSSSKKRKRNNDEEHNEDDAQNVIPQNNWRKRSIFFDLDYWKDNLLPHNLDVMHIEKNVCDNILFTLLNVDGKGKDNLNARLDLQNMGIRKALHPQQKSSNKVYLPPSSFTLSNKHKETMCNALKRVKVPDGYSSNISRRVNVQKRTISGLKSHDNHILLQELLPLALRNVLPKNVLKPLIELSRFFRNICSKVMQVDELEHIQDRIAVTLCHLERIFPPSFFDIMEHLMIHLAEEAMIGGPPQYRWMYPIERYLFTLKNYVRTRSHPEGSIAQGYWVEECLTFCSRYLDDVETKSNRPSRNDDGLEGSQYSVGGCRLGSAEGILLDDITSVQAHRYILFNTDVVAEYRDKHREWIKKNNPRLRPHDLDRKHNDEFHIWFQNHVQRLYETDPGKVTQEIQSLALGLQKKANRFSGYIINGTRYHTKAREMRRTTQNSGVMLKATTDSYASARDRNPVSGDINFYGVLTDIIELNYSKEMKFVLFKCDWADNNRGVISEDDLGFTLVNFNHLLYARNQISDEPFILASQAQQVFYVQDPVEKDWHIVVKTTPKDFFDLVQEHSVMGGNANREGELWTEQMLDDETFVLDEDISWVRDDVDGIEVDTTVTKANTK